MTTKQSTRRKAKPSPPFEDRPVSRTVQRKARDNMIQAGAYTKPLNPLVHRDPAKTITACRQALFVLAHANPTQQCDDLRAGKAYLHATVVGALESVEFILQGLWPEDVHIYSRAIARRRGLSHQREAHAEAQS